MSPQGRISSSLPPPAPGCCQPDLPSLGPALSGAETLRLIPSGVCPPMSLPLLEGAYFPKIAPLTRDLVFKCLSLGGHFSFKLQ